MSSRRKSSIPCMVRATSHPPERDDPDMAANLPDDDNDNSGGRQDSESPDFAAGSPLRTEAGNAGDLDQRTMSPKTGQVESQTSRTSEEHQEGDGGHEVKGTPAEPQPRRQHRGYECKYCPFSTHSLGDFKDHVDSSHPNVILNPLYLCAVCSFSTKKFDSLTEHNECRHAGETNFKFKRVKVNGQTVLEQTIEGRDGSSAECRSLAGSSDEQGVSDAFPPCALPVVDARTAAAARPPQSPALDGILRKDQIAAVNVNGTVLIPEPALLQGLSHVSPLLRRPPNVSSVPKIAVPLNATQYNPSLDSNFTLMASFNRFPYPTHAELSWLTAASKHPEEQIKVWFTTQRLKQGITWSPEEVEEARKKMFNGSIPPAHHTFTAAAPSSSPSPSRHAMIRTTMVEHVAPATGGGHHHHHPRSSAVTATTTTTRITVGCGGALKRPLPGHATAAFGPESKRPVMAVAPHSGDPKEKGLMAPPPPRSPLKDRLPMAPPPAPAEMPQMRQTTAVPLMPPPMSLPPSLVSKGKSLAVAGSHPSSGNPKAKPPVSSLPSIIFPESLTRPYRAPPPIVAPPFKNYLIPKEKHGIAHSLLAPDSKLPNSPPRAATQVRRPPVIQSVRSPLRAPPHVPGSPSDSTKWAEQRVAEPKAGHPRGDKVLAPLLESNGVSRDQNRHLQNNSNNGIAPPPLPGNDATTGRPPAPKPRFPLPTQFPLLERMKGKTAEQLKVLEESFLRNSFPTHSDMDNLAAAARLSRLEIESWFLERRALRDNLEQALLNSMGSKKMSACLLDKRSGHHQHQQQAAQMNGALKPSHLKSPPPPLVAQPLLLTPPTPPSNAPSSRPVPADSRRPPPALAFPTDDSTPLRWPSPEEFLQLEARTGLVRTDLIRWFGDSRTAPKSNVGGGAELPEPCREAGGTAVPAARNTLEDAWGRLANGGKTLEPKGHSGGLRRSGLPDWFSSSIPDGSLIRPRLDAMVHRLRQQSPMELKNGMHNGTAGGGEGGGHMEVFGSWLEDGHSRRGRDLLLERERNMAEDSSGRLTG